MYSIIHTARLTIASAGLCDVPKLKKCTDIKNIILNISLTDPEYTDNTQITAFELLNLLTATVLFHQRLQHAEAVQISKTATANDFQNLRDVRGKSEEAPQRVNDRLNGLTHQFS